MLKLYGKKAAERILRRQSAWIEALCARLLLPTAVLRAILSQELIHIDVLDPLADHLVRLNWIRVTLWGRLTRRMPTSVRQLRASRRGPLYKLDSSTGCAQIYAFVAINAVNFALDRGLIEHAPFPPSDGGRLDPDRPSDLRRMWLRLNRDRRFNIELAALNLLSAAEEMTGRIDFPSYTAEELKQIFTRYNGTTGGISAYGEEAYRYYLIFSNNTGD